MTASQLPHLHLVGGFLGSGKTTAIINAAKRLIAQGVRVGVITNDQGKYLVDTAFFRLSAIPAVEVGGGCFCCNYNDLDTRLAQLITANQPEVIFAESVGSCADIVATVVKPLLDLHQGGVTPTSFSVFADARLLRRRLMGQELPFSEDIVYIFDKQLEEAGLIVVNKVDLLDRTAVSHLPSLLAEHFPDKPYLLQTSLTPESVFPWFERIESDDLAIPFRSLDIDYTRYGAGEAQLAWLDEQILLHLHATDGQSRLRELITHLSAALSDRRAGIGHLKFILQGVDLGEKISLTTVDDIGWQEKIPLVSAGEVTLIINARVEIPASELRALLRKCLDKSALDYTIQSEQAFHPGQPRPIYRYG